MTRRHRPSEINQVIMEGCSIKVFNISINKKRDDGYKNEAALLTDLTIEEATLE